MKHIAIIAGLLASAISCAGTYTFTPAGNKDLSDLDHYDAYRWGINFTVPSDEVITGATLEIKNIWDWRVEEDILYVNLLNSATPGVRNFYDNQATGDYFAGQGVRVGTFSDPVGGRARNFDLKFDFATAGVLDDLKTFAADGNFGLTFDPDCHYFNDGVKMTITTEAVPEPASMIGLAIAGAALVRKKLKK